MIYWNIYYWIDLLDFKWRFITPENSELIHAIAESFYTPIAQCWFSIGSIHVLGSPSHEMVMFDMFKSN